ncbi:MAG: YggT family protein [Caldicoprobacterales bacterium]
MIYQVLSSLLKGMALFLYLYSWLIVIEGFLTIFSRPKDKYAEWKTVLKKMTDPINNIFRRVARTMGGAKMPIDLSPIVSLIILWMLSEFLLQLARHIVQ